jgi:hypothetical protein
MQKVNVEKRVSEQYVGSVYPECAADMLELEELKAAVKVMNTDLKNIGAKCDWGHPIRYRVNVKGREAIQKEINLRTGNCVSYNSFGDIVGGIANAKRLDVYIHRSY